MKTFELKAATNPATVEVPRYKKRPRKPPREKSNWCESTSLDIEQPLHTERFASMILGDHGGSLLHHHMASWYNNFYHSPPVYE